MILAAAAGIIVVPVGLALSLTGPGVRPPVAIKSTGAPASLSTTARIPIVPGIQGVQRDQVSDTTTLFLFGGLLVGAAAAVRKAA